MKIEVFKSCFDQRKRIAIIESRCGICLKSSVKVTYEVEY